MTNESSSNMMLVATTGPWFCLHLIGILLAAALAYAFACFTYAAYIRDWSMPTDPAFFQLMDNALHITLPMIVCVSGLACMFLLLENLYKHLFSGLAIFKRVHEKYLIRQGLFYSCILLPLPISDGFSSDHIPILSFYDLRSLRDRRLGRRTVYFSLGAYIEGAL